MYNKLFLLSSMILTTSVMYYFYGHGPSKSVEGVLIVDKPRERK